MIDMLTGVTGVCVCVCQPLFPRVHAGGIGPSWIPVPTKLFHDGGCGD